jgi:hypothetical protein
MSAHSTEGNINMFLKGVELRNKKKIHHASTSKMKHGVVGTAPRTTRTKTYIHQKGQDLGFPSQSVRYTNNATTTVKTKSEVGAEKPTL